MELKKRIIIIFALIAIVTSIILILYNQLQPLKRRKTETCTIEAILKSTDYEKIPFWGVVRQGLITAADDHELEIRITGPVSETEIDRQIELVYEAIARKPDAIILAAADFERLVPAAEAVRDAGISLLSIDSFLDSDVSRIDIGTDNYSAGVKAGLLVQDSVPRGSSYAVISYVRESSTAIDRELGVLDSLAGYGSLSGIKYSQGEPDIAEQQTLELLAIYPEVKAIVALNEPSTYGAARAVASLPEDTRPVLIGIDNSEPIIQYLEQNIIKAIIVQKPFNMGYLGVTYALDIIAGRQTPEYVDTGAELITRESMYTTENQKLLFPLNR